MTFATWVGLVVRHQVVLRAKQEVKRKKKEAEYMSKVMWFVLKMKMGLSRQIKRFGTD